jgi:hypothetical protein
MESWAAASSSLDSTMCLKEEECASLTTEYVVKTSVRLIESSGVVARSRSGVCKNFYLTGKGRRKVSGLQGLHKKI